MLPSIRFWTIHPDVPILDYVFEHNTYYLMNYASNIEAEASIEAGSSLMARGFT